MRMVLKFFYPDREYSYEKLDHICGRTEGKWTWSSQVAVALANEGLHARLYSTGPWQQILHGGKQFIKKHYGHEVAETFEEYTDFDSLYRSIRDIVRMRCFEQRRLPFSEIKEALQRGEPILFAVDYSKLNSLRS